MQDTGDISPVRAGGAFGRAHVATASSSTRMFSLARSGWLTATGPSIRATVTLGLPSLISISHGNPARRKANVAYSAFAAGAEKVTVSDGIFLLSCITEGYTIAHVSCQTSSDRPPERTPRAAGGVAGGPCPHPVFSLLLGLKGSGVQFSWPTAVCRRDGPTSIEPPRMLPCRSGSRSPNENRP